MEKDLIENDVKILITYLKANLYANLNDIRKLLCMSYARIKEMMLNPCFTRDIQTFKVLNSKKWITISFLKVNENLVQKRFKIDNTKDEKVLKLKDKLTCLFKNVEKVEIEDLYSLFPFFTMSFIKSVCVELNYKLSYKRQNNKVKIYVGVKNNG